MALTEEIVVDQINAREDSQLEVRTATVLKRDGVEIARTFHRHVVNPGADLSGEDARVRSIGEVLHTAEVIAAFEAAVAARSA